MEQIKWERVWKFLKQYGQYLYWVVVALMMAVFVLRAKTPGIFLGQRFYQEITQPQQIDRTFRTKIDGKATVLTLNGSLPSDGAATFTCHQNGSQLWQWRMDAVLTDGERREYKVTLKNKDNAHTVEYSVFYDTVYVSTYADDGWYNPYMVQDQLETAVRAAFGATDTLGKDKFEVILMFLAAVGIAWLLTFHSRTLFEINAAFSFSVRNREEMEPSTWYFISQGIGAVVLLILGLLLYLHAVGVIQ